MTAWDRLLDLIERAATSPTSQLDHDLERMFAALCAEASADGSVDRELHADETGRWLIGLLAAHRAVRLAHPEVAPDEDLGVLRVVITRWLHPARLGR